MKCQIPNRIIIIGGNHQNTLAAIRCFGICKCNIHVLLHADQSIDKLTCAKTKFSTGKTSVVDKSKELIYQWLISNKTDEKQILFPCSDLAAYAIDENHTVLSEFYILPGFINNPGKVCKMMSKWEQKLFASEYDIPMAKSWLFSNLTDNTIPSDIIYPCIAKPNISAFGTKSDITVCKTQHELEKTIQLYEKKGYEDIIIQELLQNNREYVSIGCITDTFTDSVMDILEKRYTLEGNTTYAVFIKNEAIAQLNEKILQYLHSAGYRGMYDIEYLFDGKKVYLLEINFRQSGVEFGQIDNRVYAPFIWCLSMLGLKNTVYLDRHVIDGKTLIDETVCLTHRKEYGISLCEWLRITLLSSAHAKFNIHDLKGTASTYIALLRR